MADTSLLDHPIISQRYFFPLACDIPHPFWVDCGDAQLACAYHKISPTAKTVIHFHGNGEVVADYLDGFPERIGSMDCNCFLAEYRGYGGSSGTPQLGRMLEDVNKILEAVGQPQDQLVFFGRSVGSLFALKAAGLYPSAAGLILESAIADPLERLLLRMRPEELGTDLNSLAEAITRALDIPAVLANFKRPVLILHTRHDGLIDVSHAERLTSWCTGHCDTEIFERGSHNDIMFVNAPRYFDLVKTFLHSL